MKTYTITNDKYSNQPDEVTFEELEQMCAEMEWDVQLTERDGKIWDNYGEIVAE